MRYPATIAFISLLTLSLPAILAGAEKPPNVVFIMADDMGYGDLGSYGATHFKTPASDRLASEGMRFTDAHSPSAVCTPTRYSVLTGRYAWRSWLKNWVLLENHPLLIDTERLTMGKIFQQTGYATGCVGKWHLGWGEDLKPDFSDGPRPGPLEVGFDEFFGVPYSHNSSPALQVYTRGRQIVGLPDGMNYRSKEAIALTRRKLEDTAIDISKEAVAFVERNKDKPFFLFYPTTNIHLPLTPNQRFTGKSKAGKYGDFMIEFDWAVGELLAALERNGLTENTIVVLTSDNGARPTEGLNGHACNGPWRGTKRMSYEGGHRVPLIVRWPGKIKAGSLSDETVCLTDFFTTFGKILGADIPRDSGEDSYDLSPLLLGEKHVSPLREATVHHSICGQFAIRQGDWKLIEGSGDGDYPKNSKGRIDVVRLNPEKDPETGRWVELDYFDYEPDEKHQLFNLGEDPKESLDLSAEHPERVGQMLKLLNHYRKAGRSAP
jgi:arylsulfatase A-like enzyme